MQMKVNINKYPHIKSPFIISIGGKLDRNYLQVEAFDLSPKEDCSSEENENNDVCADDCSSI